uniref:Uncharacterized protein n=1 Tax=Anguilla anguilla TaxID=7936 RepID=A0A0E9Q121_ANGAN
MALRVHQRSQSWIAWTDYFNGGYHPSFALCLHSSPTQEKMRRRAVHPRPCPWL